MLPGVGQRTDDAEIKDESVEPSGGNSSTVAQANPAIALLLLFELRRV
jgi:hypothetical protein